VRPTQKTLAPLIEHFAEKYVVQLANLVRYKLLLSYVWFFCSALLFVSPWMLPTPSSFREAYYDPSFIDKLSETFHMIVFVILSLMGAFLFKLGLTSAGDYRDIKLHLLGQQRWMASKRPEMVCLESFGELCPEVDQDFERETMKNGYLRADLVEHFCKVRSMRRDY
jgi:hypothetical protein